ncbi:hypothetical protein LCGC14_0232230 [marine sediment metagenome]|uniref:Uncharacterized protein n=1 Tax=marine sediment metagenome TaxID=412755 RepID=A0A0F9UA91_9ZZZZ
MVKKAIPDFNLVGGPETVLTGFSEAFRDPNILMKGLKKEPGKVHRVLKNNKTVAIVMSESLYENITKAAFVTTTKERDEDNGES